MEYALLQAVFLPLLLSPVAYILGRKVGPTPAMWFTFAILLYTTILVINAALSGTVEEHYPWTEQFGEFGFLMDGLASPFAIMIYVLSTILAAIITPSTDPITQLLLTTALLGLYFSGSGLVILLKK